MPRKVTKRKPPKVHVLNGIPKRKPKGPDPCGRLDILAIGLLGKLAEAHPNPAIAVAYRNARPMVEEALGEFLGPRNPTARAVTNSIRKGLGLLEEYQAEQARRGMRKGVA